MYNAPIRMLNAALKHFLCMCSWRPPNAAVVCILIRDGDTRVPAFTVSSFWNLWATYQAVAGAVSSHPGLPHGQLWRAAHQNSQNA